MKTSQLFSFAIVTALVGSQLACSKKGGDSGAGVAPDSNVMNVADAVGTWKSNCFAGKNGGFWINWLELASSTYSMTTVAYTDSGCATEAGFQIPAQTGSIVFEGANAALPNTWNLRLTQQDTNGQTMTSYSIAQLEAGHLYLPSTEIIALSPETRPNQVDRSVTFSKTTTPKPAPQPPQPPQPPAPPQPPTPPQPPAPQPNPPPVPVPAPVPTELIGAWKGECAGSYGRYQQKVITITETEFNDRVTVYDDAKCTNPSGMSFVQNRGPIAFDGVDNTIANGYDIHVTTSFSGHTTVAYNVVRVVNSELTLGAYWGSDANSRPTSVNEREIFKK